MEITEREQALADDVKAAARAFNEATAKAHTGGLVVDANVLDATNYEGPGIILTVEIRKSRPL